MGSPDNWYGVFGATRGLTSTSTEPAYYTTNPSPTRASMSRPPRRQRSRPQTGWTFTGGTLITAVATGHDLRADSNDLNNQQWGNFNLLSGLHGERDRDDVNGIEVRLTDAYRSACA